LFFHIVDILWNRCGTLLQLSCFPPQSLTENQLRLLNQIPPRFAAKIVITVGYEMPRQQISRAPRRRNRQNPHPGKPLFPCLALHFMNGGRISRKRTRSLKACTQKAETKPRLSQSKPHKIHNFL
jgi:hypothetical protein